MTRSGYFWLGLVVALALLTPQLALAQMSPEEQLATLRAPEGFEVQLFASEPLVRNPAAIDVDSQGRVWVAEIQHYRRDAKDPPADTIKVLEDTTGDGRADKVTVFAEGVFCPMSVCVLGDKVYVATSPDMWVYEDKDGDLKADGPPKKLLTGFGGKNHDHGAHSIVVGPDHKWYMAHGDSGFNVTGTDGSKIQYRWGAMMRGELDGSQLELLAVNFRNPYELAVSSFGEVYCSDNDNDGNQSCRICWILEGGNYGWFGGPPFNLNQLNQRLAADVPYREQHHFRAHIPGHVPGSLLTGFGSPCGMCFYEGDAFGPRYKNHPWHADAGPREVRIYRHEWSGFTPRATAEVVLGSEGDSHYRPVDVCTAPDGSVYVADWYDRGVGGHNYDQRRLGRIFRLVPKDKTLTRVGKPGPYSTVADAIEGLKNPNLATQYLAREKLLAAGDEAVPALLKLKDHEDANFWARGLWLLDRLGGDARNAVVEELSSDDAAQRALAVRILRRHGDRYADRLFKLAGDPSAEVRREVLLLAGQLPSEAALATVIELAQRYDGSDRFELETLHIAAGGPAPGAQANTTKREAVYQALAEKNHFEVDNIALLQLLKPERAAEVLLGGLNDPRLDEDKARRLIAAVSRLEDASAGKALAAAVGREGLPAEVRRLALSTLTGQVAGPWESLKDDESVAQAFRKALADTDLQVEALRLIESQQLNRYAPWVLELAQSNAATDRRLQAMRVVTLLQPEGTSEALRALLDDKDEAIRLAALASLIDVRDLRTIRETVDQNRNNDPLQKRMVERLMNDSGGALIVLRLVDEAKLGEAAKSQAVDLAMQHPDTNVRALFDRFIPADKRPQSLGAEINPETILALEGNAGRGERIFFQSSTAQCGNCHVVGNRGKNIGPDLSQIARKYDRAAMLTHVLEPSQAIGVDYQGYVLETEDGRVHAGFLLSPPEGDLVMRTIQGEVVRVPADDVAELLKQEKSLMPELLLKDATAQDAADLLAYLMNLTEEVQPVDRFRVIGPFGPGLDRAYPPEQNPKSPDFQGDYTGKSDRKVRWEVVPAEHRDGFHQIDTVKYAQQQGVAGDRTVHYALVTAESPSAQTVRLLVGSDDGVKIWVNGRQVHRNAVSRAVGFAQDTVTVPLEAGKNVILMKVENGDGPGGFALAIAAKQPLQLGVE